MILTLCKVSSAGSSLGTGGMSTKITAAKLASAAGVTTIISRASNPGNIGKIVNMLQEMRESARQEFPNSEDERDAAFIRSLSSSTLTRKPTPPQHTRFIPSVTRMDDRKFWILYGTPSHGTVFIDSGAHRALMGKAGLLPAGVLGVEGAFASQEAVKLVVVEKRDTPNAEGKMYDGCGQEVGRALVNYASSEIARIMGHQSSDIENMLGYADSEYVAQRWSVSFENTSESRPVSPSKDIKEIKDVKDIKDIKEKDVKDIIKAAVAS